MQIMDMEFVVAAALVFGLLIYLSYSLIFPEKF